MADKLKNLMGLVPRKHQIAMVGISAASLTRPIGLGSVAPTPTVGAWQAVVNVSGQGRLRGVVLVAPSGPASGETVYLQITIDGVAYSGSAVIGFSSNAYVTIPEMFVGNSLLCLLPEIPFTSSLKIEVKRSSSTVTMVVYFLYQLET